MSKIKIILNGEEKFLAKNTTIAALIADLGLDCKKIAIEKNLEIIHPNLFQETIIEEGSKIEIVHFIGGG